MTNKPSLPASPGGDSAISDKQNGFARSARLLTPAQYKRVFDKNHRSSDRYWTLLFRENGTTQPRLGMAVAKKKLKRALDRNRVKRIIRESFRCEASLSGVDVVVLPRETCRNATNAELRASLHKHWSRIAIKCGG